MESGIERVGVDEFCVACIRRSSDGLCGGLQGAGCVEKFE